jgi:putative peptidoglycan lipid II flippase
VLVGNVLMGVFLWYVSGSTERWMAMRTLQRMEWMALLVIGGAGIYFGTLYVLGLRVRDLRVRSVGPIPPRPA